MAEYNTEQFEKDCKALGVTLSDEQIRQFLKYFEMLVEWNEVMNLTAITEYDEVMKKHFVDSISLCKAYDVTQNKTVIDVGTGAGFPGLALKIAFPNLQVTLLDSLNKRINFLNEVISALGLTGVETIHGRAEDYAKPGKCREKYGGSEQTAARTPFTLFAAMEIPTPVPQISTPPSTSPAATIRPAFSPYSG